MMTDAQTVVRAWIAALTVTGMLVVWADVSRTPFPNAPAASTAPVRAASPAPTSGTDPRLAQLRRREAAVRARAVSIRDRRSLELAAAERAAAVQFVPTIEVGVAAAAPAPAPAPVATTRSS